MVSVVKDQLTNSTQALLQALEGSQDKLWPEITEAYRCINVNFLALANALCPKKDVRSEFSAIFERALDTLPKKVFVI